MARLTIIGKLGWRAQETTSNFHLSNFPVRKTSSRKHSGRFQRRSFDYLKSIARRWLGLALSDGAGFKEPSRTRGNRSILRPFSICAKSNDPAKPPKPKKNGLMQNLRRSFRQLSAFFPGRHCHQNHPVHRGGVRPVESGVRHQSFGVYRPDK